MSVITRSSIACSSLHRVVFRFNAFTTSCIRDSRHKAGRAKAPRPAAPSNTPYAEESTHGPRITWTAGDPSSSSRPKAPADTKSSSRRSSNCQRDQPSPATKSADVKASVEPQQWGGNQDQYTLMTRNFLERLAQIERREHKTLLGVLETDEKVVDSLEWSALIPPTDRAAKAGFVGKRNEVQSSFDLASRDFTNNTSMLKLHINDMMEDGPPKWSPGDTPDLGNVSVDEWRRREALAKGRLQEKIRKYRAFVNPASKAVTDYINTINASRQSMSNQKRALNNFEKALQIARAGWEGFDQGQDGRTRTREEVKLTLQGKGRKDAAQAMAMDQMYKYESGESVEEVPEHIMPDTADEFLDSPF